MLRRIFQDIRGGISFKPRKQQVVVSNKKRPTSKVKVKKMSESSAPRGETKDKVKLQPKKNSPKVMQSSKKSEVKTPKSVNTKGNRVNHKSPLTGKKPKKQGIKVDKRLTKKNKQGRFIVYKMYSYKLFNALLKGRIDRRDPNLNSDTMQIGYSEIFTKSTVTRYYTVYYLQEQTLAGFMSDIMAELNQLDFRVDLEMNIRNKPYNVDFTQNHITQKLNRWSKSINSDYEDIEGGDGEIYTKDFEQSGLLKRDARLFRSFYKIKSNQGHVHESVFILKLQTKEKEEMIVAESTLKQALDDIGAYYTPVRGALLDFLRAFSPISKRSTAVSNETTTRMLMTTKDVISSLPFTQGRVGTKGIWYGFDKDSGASVWLDIMNNPFGKNVLVMGETGAGKTAFVSIVLVFHNAHGHNMFIHDHKGNEFTSYAKSVGGIVISMTPKKTSYLSFWVLPIEDARTLEELRSYYTEFQGLAESEFLTLTEPRPEEIKDYKNIFNSFHRFVYEFLSVKINNPETYVNSKKATPEFLYDRFIAFMLSDSVKQVYSQKMLSDISMVLHKYWHEDGSRHELYSNPILMTELNSNKVVCFDFGMAEVTSGSVPQNESTLRLLFMNASCSRFVNYKNSLGEITVKVVEEIQSAEPEILKFTSKDVTEGRAKNLINYVLGNATGSLALDNQYSKNIIQNMNIRIIGKLSEDARNFYIEKYSLQRMAQTLEDIYTGGDMKYCFLIDCQITNPPVTTVTQMALPKRITESKYMKTVDYEDGKV